MATNFGRDVLAARLARGWSQSHLAEAAGIPVESVAAIESSNVTTDLDAVAAALQLVEVHVLMPDIRANFLRVVQPVIDQVPDEQLPIVLAAVLDVVGRAAAGIELDDPSTVVQSLTLILGNGTVHQHNVS